MSLFRVLATTCIAIISTQVQAADLTPLIGPVPNWVKKADIPKPDPTKVDAPLQLLLVSSQERFTADGFENYIEMVSLPQNTAGLQALGNVVLPWNAERADLTLHRVTIVRAGTAIEVLKPNEVMVLRRENNLEKAMLDGVRTVVIPARGLQAGDLLSVAATYKSRKSSISSKPEDVFRSKPGVAIVRTDRRIILPDSLSIRWKETGGSLKPREVTSQGTRELYFSQVNEESITFPKNTPARYKTPILHFSGYRAWSEVAAEMQPLFQKARVLDPKSALNSEIDRIAASSTDRGQRMLAALRLTQDRVRYVALLLGDGAYVPAGVDETWERKFGDCKGKTVLLLAILDRLGIEAEPVLVSNGFDDQIGDALPSLALFDHVLVRTKLAGQVYFLDATNYGQRTLEELKAVSFTHLLPLRDGATLEAIKVPVLESPLREASLVWDASGGTDGPIPYKGILTLRGESAAEFRGKLSGSLDDKEFEKSVKNIMAGLNNDDIVIVGKQPDGPDGTFVVEFAGKAEMDWSPFEGEKESRFAFSHSTYHWDADFDRKDGIGKDWPVSLGTGRWWERFTETVVLPAGGKGFSIDGADAKQSVAGSSMARSIRMDGNRVTMVSDFRHNQREISAEEARAAEPVLDKINHDWAYIVGPKVKKKRSN